MNGVNRFAKRVLRRASFFLWSQDFLSNQDFLSSRDFLWSQDFLWNQERISRCPTVAGCAVGVAIGLGTLACGPASADGFKLEGPPKVAMVFTGLRRDGGWDQVRR
jgi:hypothetical protein